MMNSASGFQSSDFQGQNFGCHQNGGIIGNAGQILQQASKPEIRIQMDSLSAALDETNALVEKLSGKLVEVLAPSGPSANSSGLSAQLHTQLGNELYTLYQRVNSRNEDLRDILDRIEL